MLVKYDPSHRGKVALYLSKCLLQCNTLIDTIFILQVEDAMLMFDKQTNRHRGESHHHSIHYLMLVYANIGARILPLGCADCGVS